MRAYLDYNATTPLRAEARTAMLEAMTVVGNPASVHAEGRGARAMIERARAQVATALGAGDSDIVFVSSATEAAAMALSGADVDGAEIEHDAVLAGVRPDLATSALGAVAVDVPERSVLQLANSETGIVQNLPKGLFLTDLTQAFGKMPVSFDDICADRAIVSAHKLGGPKGIGALVLRRGIDVPALIPGGGQEMGRRSGTENVIGIAGFGAAAEAAARDVASGAWERVEKLRNILENGLEAASNKTIFVGKSVCRLPNTTCAITPGWRGETQVMQMDLAGFAVSSGSACSSGKVRSSRVLQAMGHDHDDAACAVRISLGLDTKEEDVMRFVDAWGRTYRKHKARAA